MSEYHATRPVPSCFRGSSSRPRPPRGSRWPGAALVVALAAGLPAVAAAPAHAQVAPAALPSMAQPTLSPDAGEVAFVSGGDIWAVAGNGGTARLLVSHAADESRPMYSPDGARLAFVSDRGGSDDLYVLDLRAGDLTRLTWSDGSERLDAWSWDGEWLYFTDASQDVGGMSDVFRVPVRGGTPMPVAAGRYAAEYFAAPAPDGSTLAVSGGARMAGPQWWRNGHSHIDEADLWLVDFSDRNRPAYRRLTQPGAKNIWASWTPDGRSLVFMSDRDGAENLWRVDAAAARRIEENATGEDGAEALTRFTEGRVLWPALAADGGAVVFERDFGIWRMDLPDGEPRRLDIRLRGAAQGPGVEHVRLTSDFGDLALSPDGRKVAFTARGEVFATAADSGGPAARATRTVSQESEPSWGPDSRRITYASRRTGGSSIYVYDFASEAETQVTSGPGDVTPVFSPDGERIAYVREGRELRVRDVDGGRDRLVATGQLWRDPFTMARPLAWSPDNRWLAFFGTGGRMFTHVYVVPADGSAPPRAVSRLANANANSLAWSPDGKSIFFDTQHRTEDGQIARIDLVPQTPVFAETRFREMFETTPEPAGDPAEASGRGGSPSSEPEDVRVEIDWDGIFERLTLLPLGVDAGPLTLSPDGKTVVFVASAEGQQNLYSFSLDPLDDGPGVARQLTSTPGGKGTPVFGPDGKEVFYLDRGRLSAVALAAGGKTRTIDTTAELDVDFDREKLEVFQEGWSMLDRHFYDPGMHGADWAAVHESFAPRVAGARTRGELGRLMNLMVGELNASHLGYNPPSEGRSAAVGRLGLRFDAREYEASGRLRVDEVIPLSPAHVAGIRVGETILAVDGREVGRGVSLDRLLENLQDRRVELRVGRSGDPEDARGVAVRPISTRAEGQLLYRAWVASRRAYADSISDGRIGYVHMPDMGWQSLQRLMVDLDAENFGRDGVVVDIRNNNGGFVNAYALDVFARRGYLSMEVRGYPAVPARSMLGQRALEAPTVLLINQNSLSDAEDFAEGYRALELGPIVGEPTAGWIIYTWGSRLVDGGSFRMPRSLIRGANGDVMELNPRPVDIRVDAPLGEWYEGRDRQLEAAVEAVPRRP